MKKIIISFCVGAAMAGILAAFYPRELLYVPTREAIITMQKSQFPDGGIILLGDSIMDGLLPPNTGQAVLNAGIGSSNTESYLPFGQRILNGTNPKAVIIAIGVNNARPDGAFSLEAFSMEYAALCASAKETGATVFVSTVLPVVNEASKKMGLGSSYFDVDAISAMNGKIRSIAAQNDYILIDSFAELSDSEGSLPAKLSTDGVHLNQEGYRAWKDILLQHVGFCLVYPASRAGD